MSAKERFLSEVKIGSVVEVIVGPKEIKGVVISLDIDTVKIRKEDGKISTISLENIGYYEFIENDDVEMNSLSTKEELSQQIENAQENVTLNKNVEKNKQTAKENFDMSKKNDAFAVLEKRGEMFFKEAEAPTVKTYAEIAKADKSKLSWELGRISDSLDYAIKQNHESSPADYKIADNIAGLRRIIKSNHQNKVAYNMMGALYYQCKSDRLSLDEYKNGDDNVSAFAVAESINSKEDMELFACRNLICDKVLNPYILKWLISRMAEIDDYSIISKINVSEPEQSKIEGYSAFIKATLLSNGEDYNSVLNSATKEYLSELVHIFMGKNIGSGMKMVEHIHDDVQQSVDVSDEEQISESSVNRTTQFYRKNDVSYAGVLDCPTYTAAKLAREQEKNLTKAEKLYVEAIKKNERPGSAAADLVGLMMQKRNFNKAAEYLGLYGSKYMREEAYRNLRLQLLDMNPKLASKISQTAKVEIEQDYFILAQKAELEEKDLQKAITYYKEAVKKRQRLTGSIPNLVSIYIRLEMYDEALDLIDNEGKKNMDSEKYWNLRLSIFSTAKDPKYKDEIIETCEQMISLSRSVEKKMDFLFSEAYLINQIGEYEEAIDLFVRYLNDIRGKKIYYAPDKEKRQKIKVLTGLCNAYFRLNNNEKANEYAEKVLQLQPDNEFARSVISGQVNAEYAEDVIGVSRISEYILQRINKLSLENELKNKTTIEEGIFIGTVDEAERIISGMLTSQVSTSVKTSVNDETKSNIYFAIAKIIRQILDRDEVERDNTRHSSTFSERYYQIQVAQGTCFYGNYRLYRTEYNHNFDTARYCFLEAISMFQDAEQTHKCLAAALVRYMETFFCSVADIKGSAKNFYLKEYEKEWEEKIRKVLQRDLVVPVEEFVVGMIELLKYNSRVRDFLLQNILNHAMIGKIFDILGDIGDEKIPDSLTLEEFKNIWDRISEKYNSKRSDFLRIVEKTVESVFIVGQLQENLNLFSTSEFHVYLNKIDKEYIEDLKQIFVELLKYNEQSEFDYKADVLTKADDIRKRLEEKIEENPTYISFEKLRPVLRQLQAKIFRESGQFYGNSKPDISLELAGDCSLDKASLMVRVPIAYTNRLNVQNADNVQMSVRGEGIENTDDITLSRDVWIGDGSAREKMLTFKISDKVLEEGEFSLEISVAYQYKKNMTETEDEAKDFVLTVPLYSESVFEPIENRFEIISGGGLVTDKTMFFGRDEDIGSIINQINAISLDSKSGKSLVLYGQTRTGKSSILYHLKEKLREQGENNIIIDIGSLGTAGKNISSFLYKLIRILNKEIDENHKDLAEKIKERGIIMDAQSLLSNHEQSLARFDQIFDEIYDTIKKQDVPYRIVLMIDEFTYIYDWIRQGKMTDEIMKFWKAFMQTYSIFAVIIGQDHMMQFMADPRFANDFGIMEKHKVSYLPKKDALKLMDEPILYENEKGEKISRYKKGALDRLYELTSGSAYLIGKLCQGLVEYLNETHSVFITRAHIDDYVKKMLPSFDEVNFDPQYRDMSELPDLTIVEKRNKEILKRIARFSNKKEYTPIDAVIKSEEDREVLKKLEQRDVVIITNGEDRCKIKVALYKEWLMIH